MMSPGLAQSKYSGNDDYLLYQLLLKFAAF